MNLTSTTAAPRVSPLRGGDLQGPRDVDEILWRALTEDAPWGDLTSETFLPAGARARAALVAREPGVLSGITVFARTFTLLDAEASIELKAADGDRFATGDVLAVVEGDARAVLRAERIGLNLVQRLSGIATATARYVEAVAGTGARVVDTRKTTPGLRVLERAAVRHGGGHNHRFSLSDAVLAKDNHLAVLAAAGVSIGDAIRAARAKLPHTATIEVEVDRLEQIEEVVAAGVDTIMLDNFTNDELRAGIALVAGRAIIEASGGITLDTIRGVAETGVDVISVGALTHGVRSLDLGLDMDVSLAEAPRAASHPSAVEPHSVDEPPSVIEPRAATEPAGAPRPTTESVDEPRSTTESVDIPRSTSDRPVA